MPTIHPTKFKSKNQQNILVNPRIAWARHKIPTFCQGWLAFVARRRRRTAETVGNETGDLNTKYALAYTAPLNSSFTFKIQVKAFKIQLTISLYRRSNVQRMGTT